MTTLSDPPGDAGDGGINRRKPEKDQGNAIAMRARDRLPLYQRDAIEPGNMYIG